MTVRITRGPTDDPAVQTLCNSLTGYVQSHPGASAELYRRSPVSIAVRVVDPRFGTRDRFDRHSELWHYLADRVPGEVMEELGVLLTVTPAEAKTAIGSLEFDDPVPASGELGLYLAGRGKKLEGGGLSIAGHSPPAGNPSPTPP